MIRRFLLACGALLCLVYWGISHYLRGLRQPYGSIESDYPW